MKIFIGEVRSVVSLDDAIFGQKASPVNGHAIEA
jgi:hypothetical protein